MSKLQKVTVGVLVVFSGIVYGTGAAFVVTSLCHRSAEVCPADGLCSPAAVQAICVRVDRGGHGSGAIFRGRNGLVLLTADHVLTKGQKGQVGIHKRGKVVCQVEATCFYSDPKRDLSLSRLSFDPPGHFPRLETVDDIELGEDAYYCGWGGPCPLYFERTVIQSSNLICWPPGSCDDCDHCNFMVGGNGMAGNSGSSIWVKRNGRFKLAGVLVAGWDVGYPIICVHPQSLRSFLFASGETWN